MFKITIEKTSLEMTVVPRRWALVSPDKYDYTPEVETKQIVQTKVYEQSVKELDLENVICAINRIEPA